ncbi:ABC transporter permease [Emticicia sp. W12TSBA100-4]|uniref:ABC transporter permease n=1 Tax=Emticicia sp. W12TSBA100-4 TaxID=3160965 RepID=UPI003305E46F
MLRNYFKIAFRNLWKNKAYALINIVGLSVAFGSAMLLFLTARFELSFDDFQANKEHLYKVFFKLNLADGTRMGTSMPAPLTPALKADFKPEIKHISRIMDSGVQVVQGDKTLDQSLNYVDADFLRMFSFEMLKGNPNSALNDLRSIVINQSTAEKLFGSSEPLGQTINLNFGEKIEAFIVAGVIANAPENSTIESEMMIRFENNPSYQENKEEWNNQNHHLYIQLAENISQETFEKKLKPFTQKYYKSTIDQIKKEGGKPDERAEVYSIRTMPLLDEHFMKHTGGLLVMDKMYPYMLLIISILVVLIACINFINLSIARSLERAKEVGMRKALGAVKNQILGQFWGEAFILCIIGFVIGSLLATLTMPTYNSLFRSTISLQSLLNPATALVLITSFLGITLIAGGYPALVVSKFNIIEVLKGKLKVNTKSGGLRNTLIIVQFSIAIMLISSTIIIWNQIDFLRNKPLGFDETQVISIPVGHGNQGTKVLDFMRNKLANQPQIISITGADINVGRGKDNSMSQSGYGFELEGKTYHTNGLNVDYDYIKTLGLTLETGRDFAREFPSDKSRSIVINETMAKELGFNKPTVAAAIGKNIPLGDSLGRTIVGVVKDYHFESLKNKIKSMTFFLQNDFGYNYVFVKIAPNAAPKETMDLLAKTFKEIAPKSEFQGSFLDENTNNQYKKEERFSQIIMSAAVLAIVLSCMGLFAIAIMMISRRTKEIGIRKVLGASIPSLVMLLSKEFLILVAIAIVIASPIAYYAMDKWLTDFEYRIDIGWQIFALAGCVAVIIALLTVSYQAVKAALMNPVKSLKSE